MFTLLPVFLLGLTSALLLCDGIVH